jgi:hypothetical protein
MAQTEVKQALGSGVVIEAVQSLTGAESIAPDHMGRSRQSAVGYVPNSVDIDAGLLRQVELLLTRQAVLLDARRWSDWMETFTEDGLYWMPAAPEQTDWASQPSIFAEDRLLMEVRANRLLHPNAWSQAAQWATHHLLGAVIVEQASADALQARGLAAFAVSGDAADEAGMEQIVQDIMARHGRLDVMVELAYRFDAAPRAPEAVWRALGASCVQRPAGDDGPTGDDGQWAPTVMLRDAQSYAAVNST